MHWLMQYGVKRQASVDYDDLDIHDKLMLEGQINKARKNCGQLLQLMDEIQEELVSVSRKMSLLVKRLTEDAERENKRVNILLSTDAEYIELEAKRDALRAGLSMVKENLDQCRSDLRILNSAMYQKF